MIFIRTISERSSSSVLLKKAGKKRAPLFQKERFYIILFLFVLFVSCGSTGKSKKEIVITTLQPAQKIYLKAEVAADDASRMQGLMFRKSMGKKEGMIFLFPSEHLMPFWMHNTYIPLDIIFINSKNEIVDISENTKPLSDELILPRVLYRYALEVNGGFVKEHQIKIGDKINF